jgi:hypothetical protein
MTDFNVPAQERTIELFLYCVDGLKTDDDGLTSENDEADLNACAFMCHMMKTLAIVPNDIADIALFRLADETERLLVTAVIPADGDVVKDWLKARGDVVECQLGGL